MRILFICEPGSIHAARWINQFADSGMDIHICSEDPASNFICPDLSCGTVYLAGHTKVPAGVTLVTTNAEDISKHVEVLAHLIDFLKPNALHTLGMYVNHFNNRCRIMTSMRQQIPSLRTIPWIYSSWGMDLDWFGREESEQKILTEASALIDYHISEGERDIKIFKEFGFKGKVLGVLPAFGGTTWNTDNITPVEDRKLILIKARSLQDGDIIGRAFDIFPALLANSDLLRNYQIIAMQSGPHFKQAALQLSSQYNLDIKCPDYLSSQSMVLDYYRQARVWISLTINDGLPSSLVEAMSLGVVPIHSRLSSIQEWFREGQHGLLVDLDRNAEIASILRKALTDDTLVRIISSNNQQYVKDNWSAEVVKPKALEMYHQILTGSH